MKCRYCPAAGIVRVFPESVGAGLIPACRDHFQHAIAVLERINHEPARAFNFLTGNEIHP